MSPSVAPDAADEDERGAETYAAFVLRAGQDSIGYGVKLADLEDNCDLRRITVPTGPDYARIERYRRTIAQLGAQGPKPTS